MIYGISLIALAWTLMFSYGLYKTGRSLKYTYRVRLYWEARDEGAGMNDKTDVYTADRLRSTFLRFNSVLFFWLAGVFALVPITEPAYLETIPRLVLIIAGLLIIVDSNYSERTLRALLNHDAGALPVHFSDQSDGDV